MISIKAITDETGTYPETIPECKFGCYFDGEFFNYFEDQEEVDQYKANLENQPQQPLEDPNMSPEKLSAMFDVILENLSLQQINVLKSKLK